MQTLEDYISCKQWLTSKIGFCAAKLENLTCWTLLTNFRYIGKFVYKILRCDFNNEC